MTPTQNEIHPKHSYSPIRKDGLEVPETEIRLDDSPSGPNEPFRIYRTRGPETNPKQGLPRLRESWITARGDVATYQGASVCLSTTAARQCVEVKLRLSGKAKNQLL